MGGCKNVVHHGNLHTQFENDAVDPVLSQCNLTMNEMVRCVAHLYDVGKDDPTIKEISLDTWDELFKNNLRDIQSLAVMLDNFN